MCFSKEFYAFREEAQFTNEILSVGITELGRANYATKGKYYEAFVCLSTGIERIGKLCVILDHYIDNNGELPDYKYLKSNFGHDLEELYKKSVEIRINRNIKFKYNSDLDSEIHKRIISVLTDFAKGDRYSNINLLTNNNSCDDSMKKWHCSVDEYIYETCVSDKKKKEIIRNSEIVNSILSDYSLVFHTEENGNVINSLDHASFLTGVQEAIRPYRQLFVYQIIRYWTELLIELGYSAMRIQNSFIPYFSEIFGKYLNPDSYAKTRKTWDKI